ncbi:hypothetical protein K469DRAFT_718217 [Zopfia rhizophila CBS 207.26]|uniref:Uncharacterized protein n=1 Tax=Zopfia rhizophila CBS 207.26 TaxID=1314779 RepID=A0A6A6DLC9_9PEZI|nr:hypothetical protein K469DRAFT_718217 [Zopfia rhizophila CBS 207.26]
MDLMPMHLLLELVLNIITCSLPKYPNVLLHPSHPITQTLLSFTWYAEKHAVSQIATSCHTAYIYRLNHVFARFSFKFQTGQNSAKSPISSSPFNHTINDQPTATWVRELFNYTSPSLTRFIIDIPLRSLYPENDHPNVRRMLREGFLRLESLEEFVSVRDELYLDTMHHGGEPEVWRSWPTLRRLALYKVDAEMGFWNNVGCMPRLDTLVLAWADS